VYILFFAKDGDTTRNFNIHKFLHDLQSIRMPPSLLLILFGLQEWVNDYSQVVRLSGD